jgi:hypothetical protein
MAALPFLPLSPRWLAKVCRTEEGIQILADIRVHGDQDDPLVAANGKGLCSRQNEKAERDGASSFTMACGNELWLGCPSSKSTSLHFKHLY